MMKLDAVKKINTMGKVGNVLALIMKIFVILLLVLSISGLVATMVLPENLCKVQIDGKAQVLLDLGAFGWEADENAAAEVRENVERTANISYAGNHFSVDSMDMEGSRMQIGASAKMTEFNVKTLAWPLAGAIVNLILLLISTIFAGRLAKAFRDCESPFEKTVIHRMKQFAYSLVPWAVVSSVVGNIMKSIWTASAQFGINLDIGMILIVLVILALAYIVQYGAVLQQESDETL